MVLELYVFPMPKSWYRSIPEHIGDKYFLYINLKQVF